MYRESADVHLKPAPAWRDFHNMWLKYYQAKEFIILSHQRLAHSNRLTLDVNKYVIENCQNMSSYDRQLIAKSPDVSTWARLLPTPNIKPHLIYHFDHVFKHIP